MNPRQRRGVLFLLLAGLGAMVVFFMVARYVAGVNSQVAPMVTVYQAAKNIPAYRELTRENVVAVEIPERYVPPQTLRDGAALSGQRVGFTVAKGTFIGADMLLPPSELNADEREIASTAQRRKDGRDLLAGQWPWHLAHRPYGERAPDRRGVRDALEEGAVPID